MRFAGVTVLMGIVEPGGSIDIDFNLLICPRDYIKKSETKILSTSRIKILVKMLKSSRKSRLLKYHFILLYLNIKCHFNILD